ncbi:MAG: hypothetical protein LIO46_03795 [Clostridiales bacterium]|nr:hypothetical protein [Clostridiales bacterium]
MKCKQCGAELPPDTQRCPDCGWQAGTGPEYDDANLNQDAAQPEQDQAESPLQRLSGALVQDDFMGDNTAAEVKPRRRIPWKGAAAAAAVFLVFLIAFSLLSGRRSTARVHTYQFFYSSLDNRTTVLRDTDVLPIRLDGDVADWTYSFDRHSAAALTDTGVLYHLTGSGADKAAEGVQQFRYAGGGKTIAYLDEADTLFLYQTRNGKSTQAAQDVDSFVISPDGKTLLYCLNDGEHTAYLYQGGESTYLGVDLLPVAVSDKGTYAYLLDELEDNTLYLFYKGGEKQALGARVESSLFWFNRDYSEVIFTDSEARAVLCVEGGEGQKLLNAASLFAQMSDQESFHVYQPRDLVNVCVLYADSLQDRIYVDEGGSLILVTKKGEAQRLVNGAEQAVLDASGRWIYYIKAGNLYRTRQNNPDKTTLLAEEVDEFVLDAGRGVVYYLSYEELWAKRGTRKSSRIAGDVQQLVMSDDGYALFIQDSSRLEGGTLYASRSGRSKKLVAQNVQAVATSATAAFYAADYNSQENTCNIYASSGTLRFKQVLSDFYLE